MWGTQQGEEQGINEKRLDFSRWFYALMLAGLMLLLSLAVFYTKTDEKKAKRQMKETMEFLETQCEQYMSLSSSQVSQQLAVLVENIRGFGRELEYHPEDLTYERVKQRMEEQNLPGMIVLDGEAKPVVEYSADEMTYRTWKPYIDEKEILRLADQPGQFYVGYYMEDGREYNYVAVGRFDQRGILFCYDYVTDGVQELENELISTALKKYEFGMKGKIFITYNEVVISSNDEDVIGRSTADVGLLKTCDRRDENEFSTMRGDDGRNVYIGGWASYYGYRLYAFYPKEEIHRERKIVLANAGIVYSVALLVMLYLHQLSNRTYVLELRRQNEIVQAISTIYTANYVIDLQNRQTEIIKSPAHIKRLIQGSVKQDEREKNNQLIDEFVEEPFREEFKKFIDLSTMADRLKGKQYLTFTYKDSSGKWFLLILVPKRMDENGDIVAAVLVERDITNQKQQENEYQKQLIQAAEEARQANAAKTDFLRRISHDIRTPINGIRGMIEIGNYYAEDMKKQAECREKVKEASGYLLDLINDVLDMNRLESGNVQMEEVPFNLQSLLSEVNSIMELQAHDRGLSYQMKEEGVHWNLLGSPLHLRQILLNIIGNAVKYNKENGTIAIECKEINAAGEKTMYQFVCTDSGIGMSEEFQKHLFEPFSQEENSARTTYEGTGLGLSIVKKLVEQMNGKLTFTSKKGEGTSFTICIPFLIHEENRKLQKDDGKEENPEDQKPGLKGKKVLLVEDNSLNMEIAEFILESQGMTVVKSWNGQEAVEVFERSEPDSFDLILMDIMMPVMDGIQATEKIRAMKREDAGEIPIIAMTANAFSDDMIRSREAGMSAHLSKPLEKEKLIETIKEYLL